MLAGTTVNTTIYPMLNLGESPLPYEPYWSRIIPLPIPRPLRRVGDVKDKCVTRVKSVYDKRIVLSSADGFSFSSNAGNGYARFYKGYNSAKLSPIASDWLPGYAKTAYDATNEGVYSADSDAGTISIVLSIQRLIAAGATSGDTSTYLSAASAIFSAHPLTVYYQSTAYDGTNGLDVCLTEYQNDFVELDGTEASHIFEGMFYLDYSAAWPTPANRVNGVCSHYPYGAYGKGKIGLTDNGAAVVYNPNGDYTGDEGGLANWKAYLAAQKEAGTPVQVAYQLAAPETYATDPLDIDNAAGPLTVMTGGELEVRMTELVGSRSDVSNNTVAFSEASQDADITSGEKLSVLFGKIKKRFSVLASTVMLKSVFTQVGNPNLLDNSDFTNPVNQRGATSYSGAGTYCIDRWDIASTATVAVVSDGIKITATTLSGIRQKIENITDGQLLVFQLCDNADTVYTQAFAASTTQAEYTTDFGKFRFVLNSGGVLTISILLNAGEKTFKWAKLEKGSVATPYVPKGYGAELAECQRYFKRVGNRGFRGWATNETSVVCCLTLATQMRVNPTITPVGTLTAYDEVSSVTVTMDSSTGSTVDTARITAHGTGLTAFRPYSLLGNVDISADL